MASGDIIRISTDLSAKTYGFYANSNVTVSSGQYINISGKGCINLNIRASKSGDSKTKITIDGQVHPYFNGNNVLSTSLWPLDNFSMLTAELTIPFKKTLTVEQASDGAGSYATGVVAEWYLG